MTPEQPTKSTRPRKSWRKKLLLLAISSLISLLLLEGAIRLCGLDVPMVWEPDPALGWRHIPGARRHYTEEGNGLIAINDLGFRDRARRPDKPAGTYRIAILGDSMTAAVQVNLEQTYAYLLEERFRARGQAVEVCNFAVDGYSPIQELLLFKREVLRYQPDLVIVALFLDNDVAGCHPDLSVSPRAAFAIQGTGDMRFDSSRAEKSYADYHREPQHTIRRSFALYRLLSHLRHQLPASTAPNFAKRFQLYLRSPPPQWEEAWTTLERVLAEFAAEAQRQQTRLVLLSVPVAHVSNPSAWQNILHEHPAMHDQDWDLSGPDQRLSAFAHKHGLPILQAGETFQHAPHDPPLFFGGLGHLTPPGHRLMAETLEAFLLRQAFLPPAR